jgi:hypothetical protein
MIYIAIDGLTSKGLTAYTGFTLNCSSRGKAYMLPRCHKFTRCSLEHIIEMYMLQTGLDREDIQIFKLSTTNINKDHWSNNDITTGEYQ